MTARRTGSGSRRSASTLRTAVAQRRADGRRGDVGQRAPDRGRGRRRPSRSAQATRSSSCRRRPRAAATAASQSSRRRTAADERAARSASRGRGAQLVVGAEQPDRLGRAHQQVGDVARAGEQPGQPLGGLALVAQQPQVPGRRAERVATPGGRPAARRRGRRRRRTSRASRAAASAGSPRGGDTPSVSASRWRSATRRVGEAERLEPGPRGRRA